MLPSFRLRAAKMNGLILFCLSLSISAAQAQQVTQTPQQWRADLGYLAQELPRRHLNAFHTISAETWEQEVAALDEAIPTLPDHAIIVRLTQLLARIGEGHTSLSWTSPPYAFRRYPLVLTNRPDGIFVLQLIANRVLTNRGITDNQRLAGARLVRIGGFDVESVRQRVTSLLGLDNEFGATYSIPTLLVIPEVLNALGIVPEMTNAVYTLETAAGQQHDLTLAPYTTSELNQLEYLNWQGVRRWTQPLIASRPSSQLYWYEYLPQQRAVYFRYARCQEMASLPFTSFSQELLNFLNTNNVERLIVDLRGNPGGNSAILDPFIETIRTRSPLNQRGRLFVLIDNGSFSSAMLNANTFQLRTNALLVGEPTGGKPNSYGEVRQFTLPFSGLTVNYSTRFFTLRPGENLAAILPNLLVQFPWSAYVAGRDPVLEAALSY